MMTYVFIICKESVQCGGLALFFFILLDLCEYVGLSGTFKTIFKIFENIAFAFSSKIFYGIINKLSKVLLKVSSKKSNDLSDWEEAG